MNNKYCKTGIIIFIVFFLLSGENLPGASPVVISENLPRLSLGYHGEILADHTSKLTIDDVLSRKYSSAFKKSNEKNPNFGFNSSSYWFRFTVDNPLKKDVKLFLEFEYPHMDRIELYRIAGKRPELLEKNGDLFEFNKRKIKYRNVVIPIFLENGSNTEFHIRFSGQCSKQLSMSLWSPESFSEIIVKEQFAFGIYYGIILVMMLYNLFLFFFVRDSSYLYYVLYILMYGLVQMSYNGMAFQYLWPSFPAWHAVSLPFLIGIAVLAMLQFSRSFLHARDYAVKIDNVMLGIMGFSVFVMLFSLSNFYLEAIKTAMILMVIASIVIISTAVGIMKKGYRPARFFIISWVAFLTGMLLISLNKLSILPSVFITEYAIQIGSALEVTLLSVALADRINDINREKKKAQIEQMKTQEKYKVIVEGTNDIIFSLDGDFNFLTVNKAIRSHLNLRPESVKGMNFIDLVFKGHDNDQVTVDIVKEKIELFKKDKKPVSFKTEFQTSISNEPKEMDVRLEYLTNEETDEIVGKASVIEDDILLKYFECEKQQFSFGNYLIIAEDMTQRVTRNLAKFISPQQITTIRIALREIIINAIEHGNLDVTYEEKTEALMNNNYFNFLAERRMHPDYSDKKVNIVYSIKPEKAVFRISDQGDGFDYNDFLTNKLNKANEEMLDHGRGLTMAFSVFDSIEFNEKGNQVLLVKYFQ